MMAVTPTPLSLKDQMAANSAAWKTATPQMQTQLHNQNLELAKQTGQTYNAVQGTYSAPTVNVPTPTPYSPVKTQDNYVPVIGATPDPVNGGNLTEYRAPRAGDTGAGVTTPTPTVTPTPLELTKESNQTITPTPNTGIDTNALKAEAAARIAKLRAGVEGAVTAGKASRTNLKNYNDTTTRGDRVLRDATNYARSDPFQGSTMENNFRIQREDGKNDTFTNNAYTNDINALDAQLTSFDTLAPEQQNTLYNDLLRQERDYGLQEGALTGNLNGQRTLAGSAQDYNQNPNNPNNVGQNLQNQGQALTNQLNQFKIDAYPAESRAAAEKIKNDAAIGQLDLATAQFKLKELQDPNSPTNQAAKLDLQMKQLDAKNYPRESQLKLEQLQKQINQIGAAPYKSADEKAYDAQQVVKIKAEIEKINAAADKPAPAKDYDKDITRIAGLYVTPGQYGAAPKVSNPTAMRNAIIALGMDDSETDRYLTMYGLPIN